MTVKGIDVSSYQTSTFATSGLSFVFVKATEGTSYIASTQAAQAAHARAAGCVIGFYHFLHPGNAKAQAAYFVDKCASQAGDILACDWEPTSSGLASNADKDAFIKEVKRLRPDHRVVLYCDVSRWTGVDKTSYCGDGLWIADPNHAAGKPNVTHAWTFHQYGISGTDVNVANFASKAALKAWATAATPPPAPPTTKPHVEDDMALTKADLETLANTDGVFNAPADAADYSPDAKSAAHYWSLNSHLVGTTSKVRGLEKTVSGMNKKLDAMTASIATLAGLVGSGVDTSAVVAAVQKAIADAVVKVDVDVTSPTPEA